MDKGLMLSDVAKKPATTVHYCRFTNAEWGGIAGLSKKQERTAAQIIRRAVRAYLKMPAEADLPPTIAEQYGLWFLKLPKALKHVLLGMAEQAGYKLPDIQAHARSRRKPPKRARRDP